MNNKPVVFAFLFLGVCACSQKANLGRNTRSTEEMGGNTDAGGNKSPSDETLEERFLEMCQDIAGFRCEVEFGCCSTHDRKYVSEEKCVEETTRHCRESVEALIEDYPNETLALNLPNLEMYTHDLVQRLILCAPIPNPPELQGTRDEGEDCSYSSNEFEARYLCSTGLVCLPTDLTSSDVPPSGIIQATCQPALTVGEHCSHWASGLCGDSRYCDYQESVPTCRSLKTVGSECKTDEHCMSGECWAGLCAEPSVCKVAQGLIGSKGPVGTSDFHCVNPTLTRDYSGNADTCQWSMCLEDKHLSCERLDDRVACQCLQGDVVQHHFIYEEPGCPQWDADAMTAIASSECGF